MKAEGHSIVRHPVPLNHDVPVRSQLGEYDVLTDRTDGQNGTFLPSRGVVPRCLRDPSFRRRAQTLGMQSEVRRSCGATGRSPVPPCQPPSGSRCICRGGSSGCRAGGRRCRGQNSRPGGGGKGSQKVGTPVILHVSNLEDL